MRCKISISLYIKFKDAIMMRTRAAVAVAAGKPLEVM
jgi:hypothetical protein